MKLCGGGHVQGSLPQVSIDAAIIAPGCSLPSYPSCRTVLEEEPTLGETCARYMAEAFCDSSLPLPLPPDFLSFLKSFMPPPLEDYINCLLKDLPAEPFINISVHAIHFLEHLRRTFPHARTVNPHGLYLATMVCATKSGEASASDRLLYADTLFPPERIRNMVEEVERLLDSYSRVLSVGDYWETWAVLYPHHTDLQHLRQTVEGAMRCKGRPGGVVATPTWSPTR